MIGVDERFAGRGHGGDLLVDALKRIVRAADALGIAVVVLDVLDDGDEGRIAKRKALYEGYGFVPLPSNALHLYLPRSDYAGPDNWRAISWPKSGKHCRSGFLLHLR